MPKSAVKLFVGSLAYDVNEDDLRDLFSRCGQVVGAEIARDDQGRMRGFAIVELAAPEQARSALALLDGADLLGRKILVAPHGEPAQPEPPGSAEEPERAPRFERIPVILACFADEAAWERLQARVTDPNAEHRAEVECVRRAEFESKSIEEITRRLFVETDLPFAFVADAATLASAELPVLAVDLQDERGRTFRVVVDELWSVENNLSLANMEFDDFADAVDADGVFRGFKD